MSAGYAKGWALLTSALSDIFASDPDITGEASAQVSMCVVTYLAMYAPK